MKGNGEVAPSVSEICKILKEIITILDYPRRTKILNAIPPGSERTFEELKGATGISTGSLHHHLKEMERAGFIKKSEERPAKYRRSEFLAYLISLALESRACTDNQWLSNIRKPVEAGESSN